MQLLKYKLIYADNGLYIVYKCSRLEIFTQSIHQWGKNTNIEGGVEQGQKVRMGCLECEEISDISSITRCA
jgi:hypothetical protein